MREETQIGILIGMGMMLVLLGCYGWFLTSYCLERTSYIFNLVGIDTSRHYLIANLNKLMWIYVGLIVTGFGSLLTVALRIRPQRKVEKLKQSQS
jgi:glucan phosphoethanolaminetransferase (alkaline phosphatase superfamily)